MAIKLVLGFVGLYARGNKLRKKETLSMNPDQPVTTPITPLAETPVQPIASHKPSRKKPLLIALIVAILVIAGIAYGAYAYVTNTPEYALRQATEQLGDDNVSAAKFSVTSGTSANGVTVSGDVAWRSDAANPKNGEGVIGFGTGNSRVTATVGFFDGALYFKLGSLANASNLAKAYGLDKSEYASPQLLALLKNVDEKWFTVSKEDLQGFAKSTGGNSFTGTVSVDEIKNLKTIYDKNSFLRPDKVYADEVVDGKNSAHFSVKLDRPTYIAFLNAVKAANLQSFKVTNDDLQQAQTEPETPIDGSIEVWVARDSKKLKQIRMASTKTGSEMSVTVTLLTDLPKLEKLQKPTNAKPFSEFISTLLGPYFMPTDFSPTDF